MDRKIKAIIFDLDGVLTNTSEYHYMAWKYIADSINVYFDKNINENLKGVDRMKSLGILLGSSNNHYSHQEKIELAMDKNKYYRRLINNITPDDLFPGVNKLIENIKTNNIRIALGSASKNAMVIIRKLGIEYLFDVIVDANNIKNSKPDPEIFIKAADILNLTYDECAVIEDSEAGIIAAKKAGMLAIGIGDKRILREADFIYSETKDVDLIESGILI